MAKRKDTEEPQLSARELLEARVDAMMDPASKPAANQPALPSAPPLPSSEVHKTADNPTQPTTAPVIALDLPIEAAQEPTAMPPASTPEATVDAPSEISIPPLNLDTPQSDAAIDDIVAQEADEVLAAEDAGVAQAYAETVAEEEPQKQGHPVFWFVIVVLVVLAAIAAISLMNPNLSLPFGA